MLRLWLFISVSSWSFSGPLDHCQQLVFMWGKDYVSQCTGFSISVLDLVGVEETWCDCPGETDSILGNLMFVPNGTFTQGTNTDPCHGSNEIPFTHTLTRDILVMKTEVSRQMWEALKVAQPSLPVDPTDTNHGSGENNPAQNETWYEIVLFSNLLSLERGLARCYYTDTSFTTPVDSTNYTSGSVYCDFDANGYRLPSEGEREYFTRAGTKGPFSIDEPNYNTTTCGNSSCGLSTLPELKSVAWFCANNLQPLFNTSKAVGLRVPNPWGLKDVHGNVWEAGLASPRAHGLHFDLGLR